MPVPSAACLAHYSLSFRAPQTKFIIKRVRLRALSENKRDSRRSIGSPPVGKSNAYAGLGKIAEICGLSLSGKP